MEKEPELVIQAKDSKREYALKPIFIAGEHAQKSINWTIFIQLLRQHLRYDCDYKN